MPNSKEWFFMMSAILGDYFPKVKTRKQIEMGKKNWKKKKQPCGHPISAIVSSGTTSYCRMCEEEAK